MKKQLLTAIAVVILAVTLCIGIFAADITVGTAQELEAIMLNSARWSDNITLTADIDLTGIAQNPIGTYSNPFTGTFDGAGFTISGLDIATPETVLEGDGTLATVDDITAGLFGVIKGATVKNLTVKGKVVNNFVPKNAESKVEGNHSATGGIIGVALLGSRLENLTNMAEVTGPCHVGGVAGYLRNFDEDGVNDTLVAVSCSNYGTLTPSLGNCGGVFARIYAKSTFDGVAVSVDGCSNFADLSSASVDRNRLAAIAGYVRTEEGIVEIKNCRNEGNITGDGTNAEGSNRPFVGSVIGRAEVHGVAANPEKGTELSGTTSALQISNCVNIGDMNSTYCAGGMVSLLSTAAVCTENPTFITNCLNTGKITGPSYAGGIISYTNCTNPAADADGNPLTIPYITNCLNTGAVEMGSYSAGIIGQVKNVTVANNVTTENMVYRVAATDAGTYSVVENNYYVKGNMVEMAPVGNNTSLEFEQLTDASIYTALDFENTWVMGDKCPMLKMAENEVVNISAPIDIGALIPQLPEETTAPETTAVEETTAAPATEEGSFPVAIVVIAAVVVIAVVAVVVVVSKKKK
ncbi:MAG: hypothetical protein E7598_01005 [Ruminococcaceae bacterium]|nr:hypothetical protein [Oscillospiraceae bacterium]